MRNFEDLRVWRAAHELVLEIYTATKSFPRGEQFGLTSQIRRCSVSIEANLAEGCGRQTDGELARFVHIAMGSASELASHLRLVKDLKYLTEKSYESLLQRLVAVRKMLSAFLKSISEA